MADFEIERMQVATWTRVRAIRLRALADAPDAFGTMLQEEQDREPDSWRARLAASTNATFVATRAGADVGLVAGAPYDDGAGLFSMWVAPEARGTGVGRALVETVIRWARAQGHAHIRLDVGDYNEAAIRLYAACGFEPSGITSTLPPPRAHVTEHQRERRL